MKCWTLLPPSALKGGRPNGDWLISAYPVRCNSARKASAEAKTLYIGLRIVPSLPCSYQPFLAPAAAPLFPETF